MRWFSLTFFEVVLMRWSTCSLTCLVNICGNAISGKIQPRWWWRTGKAGVLQSMESQTVRCDQVCCSPWYYKELDTTEQLNCNNVILGGTVVKNPPVNAGDASSIPGVGRSPGGGNGYPLQYSCLKNSMTEEPGRLQSVGSQRVSYDSVIEHMQYPR